MLGVVSAAGGLVMVAKSLYEFYDQHKRNRAVLDILDGFTHNLSISIERLRVREQLMLGKDNPALDSIEKDFTNAGKWLHANDKNLRSVWTTLQACDKLKDLDDRLTKSFASKFSVALFMALQDVRQSTTQIKTKLDEMGSSIDNLEVVCREATRTGLQEAIKELKQEAWAVAGAGKGKDKGFTGGEAEKIISALVDRLSEQERIKEEEERTGGPSASGPSPAYEPSTKFSSSIPRSVSVCSIRSSTPTVAYRSNLNRALTSRSASAFLPAPESSTSTLERSRLCAGTRSSTKDWDARSLDTDLTSIRESDFDQGAAWKVPAGQVALPFIDPLDQRDMIDPVLASDGLIYDRWSLIENVLPTLSDSLIILGDVVQLREAIYTQSPSRRTESNNKRQLYREETLRLYAVASYGQMFDLVDRLSHCILCEPTACTLRLRRAIALYRIRDFDGSMQDLNDIMEQMDVDKSVKLETLRIRSLVKYELNAQEAALIDCSIVLNQSPNDVLVLSIQSCLRTAQGDLRGAQLDLANANRVVSTDMAYKSILGSDDLDLEFVCRGWAYASGIQIRDYDAAARDFSFALSFKPSPDPYISGAFTPAKKHQGDRAWLTRRTACLASAQVQKEVSTGSLSTPILIQALSALDSLLIGLSEFAKALSETADTFVVEGRSSVPPSGRRRRPSGARLPVVLQENGQCWTTEAYPILFMRASALYSMNDFESALRDLELGLLLRPSSVQDTGPFRALLAELRVENGQRRQASHDWLWAIALDPESKFSYESKRQEYGL
ncbi:hypothetical protein OIV83_005755 [Microbotryomycetes sp. JL201]|nr:hypothetical protein OIV83_005755 [Microbotryomycetes sp. JL201]